MTTRLDRYQARRYADGLQQQVAAAEIVGVRDAATTTARDTLGGIRTCLAAGARILAIGDDGTVTEVKVELEPATGVVSAVAFQDPPVKPAPKPKAPTKPKDTPVPDGMTFRDPPPSKAPQDRPTPWTAKFDALRANPGKWALVYVGTASQASNITGGLLKGSTRGEFEATTRSRKDGKCDIYARYPAVSA